MVAREVLYMEKCYITFRSVTIAQRAESILKREGYQCYLQRTPKWMGQRGCGYALLVRQEWIEASVAALRREQAAFSKVYCQYQDVVGEEMML